MYRTLRALKLNLLVPHARYDKAMDFVIRRPRKLES